MSDQQKTDNVCIETTCKEDLMGGLLNFFAQLEEDTDTPDDDD